jgi:hypothetical protein
MGRQNGNNMIFNSEDEKQECSGSHFLRLLNHSGQADCCVPLFHIIHSFKSNRSHITNLCSKAKSHHLLISTSWCFHIYSGSKCVLWFDLRMKLIRSKSCCPSQFRNWEMVTIVKSLKHPKAQVHFCLFFGFCDIVRHPSTPHHMQMKCLSKLAETLGKPVFNGVAVSLYANCQNLFNAVSCRTKFHSVTPEINCPLLSSSQINFSLLLITIPIRSCEGASSERLALEVKKMAPIYNTSETLQNQCMKVIILKDLQCSCRMIY